MTSAPIWTPNNEIIQKSNIKRFIALLNSQFSLSLDNYDELYQFSIQEKEKFWSALWDFSAIIGTKGNIIMSSSDLTIMSPRGLTIMSPRGLTTGSRLDPAVKQRDDTFQQQDDTFQQRDDTFQQRDDTFQQRDDTFQQRDDTFQQRSDNFQNTQWFIQSRLNYAENILKHRSHQPALIFNGEHQIYQEMSFAHLYSDVSKIVQFFKSIGLKKGERVALLANNAPQTVVCVLAASALGAVSSLCSTDFGAESIVQRISQIEPTLFVYFDNTLYNGKKHSQVDKVRTIVPQLPTLKNIIKINYFYNQNKKLEFQNEHLYDDILNHFRAKEIPFERVAFSHPLYIVYSSGTTGVPKCIVHSHGGVLLQHKKEHLLHCDIKPQDSVFYYTTCGWMMWQWLLSALSCEASIILYDGSPFYKDHTYLLKYLNEKDVSFFGTSAKYIDNLRKLNENIKENFSFNKLKIIGSTGSPLIAENFDYIYTKWKKDVQLASLSGGTDILSCFVLGCPIKPVYRGEIQCIGLGMQVEIFDEAGQSIKEQPGELVCTAPFPSMPVCFWNDQNDEKYKKSYFERYPNVWCHGDWATLTNNGGCVIYGRSDATLNPSGIRIGTAEIYRQVEQFSDILESVVTEYYKNGDSEIVLFIKMRDNAIFNESIINSIKEKIRINCSPRHVPAYIFQVQDIPKTKSGKIMELAVKNIINNREVNNQEAMQNPESLLNFQNIIQARSRSSAT